MAAGFPPSETSKWCSWLVLLLIALSASASATGEEALPTSASLDGDSLRVDPNPAREPAPDPLDAAEGQAVGDTNARTDEFEDDDDLLEELVVTARKRRELLQDIPVSVSVLGGSALERRGVSSLEQIAPYIPNLSAWEGVQGAGTLYSRGVGQRDSLVSLDPGVGLYIDDAYVARAQGALLSTVDIERIEVLRGPQGTLYGKNTIGGAVKVITRKPGPTPEAAFSLTGGNLDTLQYTGMFNVPVVDDLLYTRFNIASRDASGFNRNRIDGKDHNDDQLLAFRGQARLLPADDVTLDFTGHFSDEREQGNGAKCKVSNAALPGLLPPPNDTLFTQLHSDCSAAQAGDAHEFTSNLDDKYSIKSYGASMTGLWELGPRGFLDNVELKTVTSLREQVVNEGDLDLDATQSTVVNIGIPVPLTLEQRMLTDMKQSQASQELQLSATTLDDHVKFTGGFYGFWEKTDGGNVDSNNFGVQRLERIEIDTSSYSAYAQSSYSPWDWFELSAGFRFTAEDKQADRKILAGATPVVETPFETDQKLFTQWTPMAGFALSAPEAMLEDTPLRSGIAYFSYAQGFKSGGFSTRRNPALFQLSDFEPEKVDNFELGLKFDSFDSRLLVNTSLFYSLYRDMQLTVQRVNPAAATDIGSAISNAGRATIWGFEVESVIRPVQDMVARIAVGLTDAKYDRFVDNGLDRSNESFFNVPKWNVNTLLEYAFDLEDVGLTGLGSITPAVNVSFQTDTNTHFTNQGYKTGFFRQDAFALVDLRLVWDLADERTRFMFFMKNVTDEEYYLSSIDLTDSVGLGSRYYSPPRTFGATVSYRWDADGWGGL
jgi:iron complex outermembrane receptor protein